MTLVRSGFKRTVPSPEPKPIKGARQRKCKHCGTLFAPFGIASWCSPECGTEIGIKKLAALKSKEQRQVRAVAKADRVATKKKLESFKPLEFFLKKAEAACNEYIRARDPDICISCRVTYSSAWQAGHFISVGANKTLRYHEDNIHKQCIKCNMFDSSNAINYRIHLLEKIGIERVEWLEGWHPAVKMTREAAEEIEGFYRLKLKQLLKDA